MKDKEKLKKATLIRMFVNLILQVIMLRMKKDSQIMKLVKLMPFIILGIVIMASEANKENFKENLNL